MWRILQLLPFYFIFSDSKAQPGEWVWMNGSNNLNASGNYGTQGVFNSNNSPPSRYEACEWTDHNGNFWLFGGRSSQFGLLDELWEFDPAINQWAWIRGSSSGSVPGHYGSQGVSSPQNYPGSRAYGCATWTDTTGNLWLFGGLGIDGMGYFGNLNDLWKYDVSLNEWTWMEGNATVNSIGYYGVQGVSSPLNNPPSRCETDATWTDVDNNLWLFGGKGNGGLMNDLWKYNIFTNEWTWMKGDNSPNHLPYYGSIGVSAPSNSPGSRLAYTHWVDYSGKFWLFGGETNSNAFRNDLWRYDPTQNEWTWMSGDDVPANLNGFSSGICLSSNSDVPSARFENRACWTRDSHNFQMFGGLSGPGYYSALSDLWNYNIDCNIWTLLSGSLAANLSPNYGTQNIPAPLNNPGSRAGVSSWKDIHGNLWLFGGCMHNTYNDRNDLWKFIPSILCSSGTAMSIASFNATPTSGCAPLMVSFTNTSTNAVSVFWSFGDGDTSTLLNPLHLYSLPGDYSVMLIISAPCGGAPDTLIYNYIQIFDLPVPVLTLIGDTVFCSGDSVIVSSSAAASYQWNTGDTTQNITIYSTGIYSVTVTDSSGCQGTVFQNVLVNPNPVPQITSSGPLIFCQGGSVTLTSNNQISNSWNVGFSTSSITVYMSGYYSVTVIDSNGCTGISTVSVNVNPNPIPVISAAGPFIFCSGDSLLLNCSLASSYIWNTGDTTQSTFADTAGTYIVTVIDSNGCVGTSSQTVLVNPLPVPMIAASGSLIFCEGDSVVLTSTPANNYTWNTGNTTQSIVADTSGNYYVTVIDANGCTGTSAITIVLVNPLPPVPIIMTVGGNLFSSANSGNQWYLNHTMINNATDSVYSFSQPGCYTVVVTDSNGCSAMSDSVCIIFTGISEKNGSDKIRISPNPNGGVFTIYFGEVISEMYDVMIYDAIGRLSFQESKLTERSVRIDLENLATGIYIVRMNNGENIYSNKLVLK